MQEKVEAMAGQQKSERRTLQKSRPRSTYTNKNAKKNIAGRFSSVLRRRRSRLNLLYRTVAIEIAESRLNLDHPGMPGLIYAVPEIPKGYTRQSLIDIFDEIIENMEKGGPLVQDPLQGILISPVQARPQPSSDLLTGEIESPDDYDQYRIMPPPLSPTPTPACSSANLIVQRELSELNWSPFIPKHGMLIDQRTDSLTHPLVTPTKLHPSYSDELFLDGQTRKGQTTPSPSLSAISLKTSLWPVPLKFHDSPFPVLDSPTKSQQTRQSEPTSDTNSSGLTRKTTSANLKLATAKPNLQITPPSLVSSRPMTATPKCLQPGQAIHRKPVPETPTSQIYQQSWAWKNPFSFPFPSPSPYRPFQQLPNLPDRISPAPSTSFMDELNNEVDRLLADINPIAEPPSSTSWPGQLDQASQIIRQQQSRPVLQDLRQSKVPSTRSRSHTLPRSRRIPLRTASRTHNPTKHPAQKPEPRSNPTSGSFRDRLGKSTLAALLSADSTCEFEAAWECAKRTRPGSGANVPEEFSWRRWVDQDWR